MPALLIATSLGSEKAQALPFFHAITGCYITSAFAGIDKRTAWDGWVAFPEVPTVFAKFSRPCTVQMTTA